MENILLLHECSVMIDAFAKYIPATAGPIALPIALIRRVIPSDVPLCCFGVDSATTFITPTMLKDKPVAKMARFTEIEIQLNGIQRN